MNIRNKGKSLAGLMAILALAAPSAHASERESLEQLRTTTLSLIELLVQEGVLSKSKADQLMREAEAARVASAREESMEKADAPGPDAPAAGNGEKVVRVQYVPEHVKNEMRAEIEKDVMAKLNYKAGERLGLPEWVDRIQWEGDMRLRYEMDSFPDGNDPAELFQFDPYHNAGDVNNTTEERNRFRVRARLGAKLNINDWLDGGIRMTTGRDNDPVSPNQTIETEDSKFSFALDRAYLRAKPVEWGSVSGGRIENPYLSTDLVWDPDLAFDGVAASIKPKWNDRWSAFGTLGAFVLDEQESSDTNKAEDKWLFGAQAGLRWTSASQSAFRLGAALYDFKNVQGKKNPVGGSGLYDETELSFRSKGNTTFSIDGENGNYCGSGGPCGLASDFRELNLTAQLDLAMFNPVHVILAADYVKNIGFDSDKVYALTDQNISDEENEGYQLSLTVGMPRVEQRHDWQVYGSYKHLEADAVLDAFTDSDFNLGGTNAKGWILGASYGLDKNTWLSAKYLTTDQITEWNPDSGLLYGRNYSVDVLLIDLNARF